MQPTGSTKYGYINRDAQFVIEPGYDLSLPFHEGLATVKMSKPDGSYWYRIIDKSGKPVGNNLTYAFVGIFREGLAGVETFDQRWGFIDRTGKEVITPRFASVKLFNNGLSRIETGSLFKGLKVEYIDKSGKVVWKE